jgi:CRP-like cAMP-binding protein
MIVIMYEHWIDLFSEAPQSELSAGSHIFLRGDEVRSLHFVCKGEIKLTRVLQNGTELTLHSACENQVLAEASLFSESYHCDAIACETSSVAALPKSQVLEALIGSELSGLVPY